METYQKEFVLNGAKVYKTYAKIENLHFDPNNPREISDARKADLVEFLTRFGAFKPLLVDFRAETEGQIIGGNMRLEAMQNMGMTEVWIEPRVPRSDAQAFEMATLDNMEFGNYVELKLK